MLNIETTTSQANTYCILARLFDFPDEDYHGQTETYQALIHEAKKLEPKFLELSRKLAHSAKGQTVELLKVEYLRLFDPAQQNDFTILRALTYFNQKDVTLKHLMEAYETHEFILGYPEYPPDHLCNEMDFTRHLNERLLFLLKAGSSIPAMELQKFKCSFMRDHLMKWLPELTKYILFNSNSPYFLQLSIIARTVLVNCINRDELENQRLEK
jgi:TorA maturation chaperone TorD